MSKIKHSFYNAIFNGNNSQSDSAALVDSSGYLSYKDLQEKVLHFSSYMKSILPKLEHNQNACIVINIEKSLYTVVWQLACSHLGLAFLCLDKKQEERNKEIIQKLKPILIINNINNNEKPHYFIDFFQLSLFSNYKTIPTECEYIVFSSGSTGNPKGILLKGQPAMEVVSEQSKILNINSSSRYLWMLNPAFDASLSDIYCSLISGACLVVFPFPAHEIKKLFYYLKKYQITHVDLPPSMFSIFLNQYKRFKNNHESLFIECIVFGGETANENIAKKLSQHFKLIQAYGPTETTICSSMNIVDENWKCLDIGTPLKNVFYKVNNQELHIGGTNVAIGYLADENSSLNDKFYFDENIKWYKTGDMVSYIDGKYIFKGRVDRQFKFHSQLICPEEIEACAIKNGAIYAHIEFNKKIILYYSGQLNKISFEKSLASYMKPQLYVKEDNFDLVSCLNSNNKIIHKQHE